jgi:hypothetical protein
MNASTYFLLEVIYIGIICIGCVALFMDMILRRISAPAACVAGKSRRHERDHGHRHSACSVRSRLTRLLS